MGGLIKAVGGLLGGLMGGSAPKANVAPATKEVAKAADDTIKKRTALLETAGGAAGAVLQPGQVQNNQTIFGN